MAYTFLLEWFYGIDSAFEIISILVCFLVAYFSRKSYCVTGSKSCKHMTAGFLLIGGSLFIKIITNLILLYFIGQQLPETSLSWIYIGGYFIHRFMFAIGILVLLLVAIHVTDIRLVTIFGILITLNIAFANHAYFIYHLILSVMLWYIIAHYYQNYNKKKTCTARMVFVSFCFLMAAQLLYLLVEVAYMYPGYVNSSNVYATAEGIQLLGFLSLLANHVLILRKK